MKTHEDNYKMIGSKIRLAREFAGISQKELADKIGYESATAISLIESGERKVSITDLQKIGDLFDRDIKYFLNQEDQPNLAFALRADQTLSKKEQDQILDFIDFVKGQNGRKK